MAISETKGQGWKVICTQWRKASDIPWPPFCSAATQKRERDREARLNYYASAYNRGDNYRITRLKLNRPELNKHASLTKWFSGIEKVRRIKKEEGKIQIGKVSKTKIQISHIHTAPKSTSESQTQITHLLTAPEPARGYRLKTFYQTSRI